MLGFSLLYVFFPLQKSELMLCLVSQGADDYFYFLKYLFIYLFIFGCVGSLLLRAGFLQLQRAGTTLGCSEQASHCGGSSCCAAWALGAWAQQLWRTGLVAPRHVGSSRTGLEPMSPALAGRFLTTAPPEKSPDDYFGEANTMHQDCFRSFELFSQGFY